LFRVLGRLAVDHDHVRMQVARGALHRRGIAVTHHQPLAIVTKQHGSVEVRGPIVAGDEQYLWHSGVAGSLTSRSKPSRKRTKKMEERHIEVEPGQPVSLSVHGVGDTALVLGHGAGGTRRMPVLLRLADALSATGRRVLLFNFPYSEARRRMPDKAPLLE